MCDDGPLIIASNERGFFALPAMLKATLYMLRSNMEGLSLCKQSEKVKEGVAFSIARNAINTLLLRAFFESFWRRFVYVTIKNSNKKFSSTVLTRK